MKKYLVIGNPIEHSLSPQLHNYWIKINKIDATYEKRKLSEMDLEDLVFKVKKGEINGANITVPFKNKVIPFLDILSEEAKITQSVNTIYFDNGSVIGHNTDIEGFKTSIKKINYSVAGKRVFILGSGGVVPSIIFALGEMGASEIILSNRTKSKAENIKNLFKNIDIVSWGKIPDCDIIINATSIGLKNQDRIEVDFSSLRENKFFYDLIYNPEETHFLRQGKKLGNKTQNGKMMFIYQAYFAFKIWHGFYPKVDKEVINLLDQ